MILVTGATGTVGSAVVEELSGGPEGPSSESATVRAATRSTTTEIDGADETVVFDFTDPSTYRRTFEGVETVFLVRPPALSRVRRDVVPALAAAVGAGVEHVVFLSVIGADRNPIVPHARIESWLESAPVSTAFLRASFFMQNLTTTHREEIRRGALFVPAGSGRTSFVDARDVAAVAAGMLRDRTTGAYDLTGPEALTYETVCRRLSAGLGRKVTYAQPSLPRFLYRVLRSDRDVRKGLVMSAIYTTARLGLAARVTEDLEGLLGRRPTDFETFVRDHRAVWS